MLLLPLLCTLQAARPQLKPPRREVELPKKVSICVLCQLHDDQLQIAVS